MTNDEQVNQLLNQVGGTVRDRYTESVLPESATVELLAILIIEIRELKKLLQEK